jgi:hypothetical protein
MVGQKIQGPAAAMFDEQPPQNGVPDDLFDPSISQFEIRMQIVEQRLNEIYEVLLRTKIPAHALPINGVHYQMSKRK